MEENQGITSVTPRSVFGYHLAGRQVSQSDYDAYGYSVVYSRMASYDAAGKLATNCGDTILNCPGGAVAVGLVDGPASSYRLPRVAHHVTQRGNRRLPVFSLTMIDAIAVLGTKTLSSSCRTVISYNA